MKNKKIHGLSLFFGLLVAVSIVFSNVYHPASDSEAKVKSEQKSESSSDNFTFISAPTITPPASAHLQINFLAYCLFEISLPQAKKEIQETEISQLPRQLLMTLFRVIISPNAP